MPYDQSYEFLPSDTVRAVIDENGAKFIRVTFVKKNGEETTRVGRPKTYSRRVGGENGPEETDESVRRAEIAKKSLKDNGNFWLDYPKIGEDGKPGFSFNLERVIAIGGMEL